MSGRPTNRGRRRWRHVLVMCGALGLGGLPSWAADRGLLPHHPRVADAQIAVPTVERVASTRDAERRLVSSYRETPAPTPPSIASARTVTPTVGRDLEAAAPETPAKLPFDALVRRAAHATSVDAALLHAIIDTESGYDPQAVSERGAIGLMQILPRTGQRFGVRRLEDPAENLRAGASYLRWLLSRFNDDVSLALAAYNAGEGAVLRYGRQVPPFRETQNYVRKVMASYSRLRDPAGTDAVALPLASGGAALASAAQALVQADDTGRSDIRDKAANVRTVRKAGGAEGAGGADVADDKNARAWRLLQGLGELITRSPSADARRRDQPAVVMPGRRPSAPCPRPTGERTCARSGVPS
ncbi:lytic transglycosylase domain-containing protein [Pandoraea sp. NPDC090278]|uniref:lytic transglycosylase domain-containing protein n=1 Tax=Pandoraea sp. NPDC090278 TaxID=3364391 RepID=UPI00383AE876